MAYLLLFLDPGRMRKYSQCPVKISLYAKILKLIWEPQIDFFEFISCKYYNNCINMGLIAVFIIYIIKTSLPLLYNEFFGQNQCCLE